MCTTAGSYLPGLIQRDDKRDYHDRSLTEAHDQQNSNIEAQRPVSDVKYVSEVGVGPQETFTWQQ
jgi:hypothetical protein